MAIKITANNSVAYSNTFRGKRAYGRKTHANKVHFVKVKCPHCESEGCKPCNFTGLIEIK